MVKMEPAGVCTRSSAYMLWPLVGYFCGTSNSGRKCVSDSVPALRTLLRTFPVLGCLVQDHYMCFCLV